MAAAEAPRRAPDHTRDRELQQRSIREAGETGVTVEPHDRRSKDAAMMFAAKRAADARAVVTAPAGHQRRAAVRRNIVWADAFQNVVWADAFEHDLRAGPGDGADRRELSRAIRTEGGR